MPRVAKDLYSSGKDRNQRDKAREFLKKIGVREVGEKERIEAILRDRYFSRHGSNEGFASKIKDIKRFIDFVVQHPNQAYMFKHYSIFKLTNGKWGKPSEVYIDSPFYETGLSAYYDALGDEAQYWALSEDYEKCGISPEKIGKFAKEVGAQNQLCVKEQSISWDHPLQRYSDRTTYYKKGIDYDIPEFGVLLNDPNLRKSRLIRDTMNRLSGDYLEARYRPNKSTPYRTGESTLVRRLREEEWVPQIESGIDGIESFVKPSEVVAELLPKGFLSEAKAQWLEAVELEKNKRDREAREHLERERATQEYKHKEGVLKSVGFNSVEQAQKLARLNKENPGVIDELIRKQEVDKQRPTFPERTSRNPDRRQEKVEEQHANASEKKYEERKRSVRTSQGEIDPKTYLREQYTNDSGEMVCQICKEEMPFKKRDGEYYFEKVEALSGEYFPKEDDPQSIALCPLCAAMYKEFVIRDEDAMKELHRALKDSDDFEVPLELGELETSIRFVETHRIDVKTVLQNSV